MRTRRARSRSETSASPLAKKAMRHGTFRSSAIVPATFGVGGPGSAFRVGVELGLRLALALGLGLALALGLRLGLAAPADGTGVLLAVPDGDSAHPARPPTPSPASPRSTRRRARPGGSPLLPVCRGGAQ